MEVLSRDYNINYRACVGSLIYLLSTRVDLCFTVHGLGFFSSNTGKVHFEGLIHLLRYIWDNKNLGLKYYAKIDDSPPSNILRQDSIKTENKLMVFYYSIWLDFPYTGRSTRAYIVF